MSILEITKAHFLKNDTWRDNDWYECPGCGYDSIDIGFKHCPCCGEGLRFDLDGEG